MPKKLEAQEAKPFQPIKTAFLKGVLDDAPAEGAPDGNTATAVETNPEPQAAERKVLPLHTEPEVPLRRGRAPLAAAAPGGERLNRPLKVQLQASERLELARIVNELSSALGTPLSVSHVTRALLTVFRHTEVELQKRARQHGSLKRPANDDLTAIAVFEHELAKLVLGAMREAKPLRE